MPIDLQIKPVNHITSRLLYITMTFRLNLGHQPSNTKSQCNRDRRWIGSLSSVNAPKMTPQMQQVRV